MKAGKEKIALCKGKNSCAVVEHTVPSSVFAAFVYDGWWDSKSSINLGGKAPDTIKIAEFYWSSPLSGSFTVLSSWLHSVHVHLGRGKRFLWGWTEDTFFCRCCVDTSSTGSGCSVDNVPKISSENFTYIRKTYASQDDKVIQGFCLTPVFNLSVILFAAAFWYLE